MNTQEPHEATGLREPENSGMEASSAGSGAGSRRMLRVRPRYQRLHVDPDVEWIEPNVKPAHLDWQMPTDQAALVLLDVWNEFYLKDTHERTERIVREKLAPLVNDARERGIQIIHAPSDRIADQYPQWVGKRMNLPQTPRMPFDDWPPPAFKQRVGPYAGYGRPSESRAPEIAAIRDRRAIHPSVKPHETDVVIATGDELHQYCHEAGLLFLFYAGFYVNACMTVRDYAPVAMTRRGFATIIVRDATTAIETAQSHHSLDQTQNFIQYLEMFTGYSVTSDEIVSGFE